LREVERKSERRGFEEGRLWEARGG